jgi:hypothetical protein
MARTSTAPIGEPETPRRDSAVSDLVALRAGLLARLFYDVDADEEPPPAFARKRLAASLFHDLG